MGWRGYLRSLNTSSKRTANKQQEKQRSQQQSMDKIDRNSDAAYKKAVALKRSFRKILLKL